MLILLLCSTVSPQDREVDNVWDCFFYVQKIFYNQISNIEIYQINYYYALNNDDWLIEHEWVLTGRFG